MLCLFYNGEHPRSQILRETTFHNEEHWGGECQPLHFSYSLDGGKNIQQYFFPPLGCTQRVKREIYLRSRPHYAGEI